MEECNLCHLKVNTFSIRICKHNICYECLVKYLQKFEKAKIKCPIAGCQKTIQDMVIRECLSNDQILYYNALCYPQNVYKCGIKGCSYFIAYENKNIQFECPNCKQPNCVSCGKMHYPTEICNTDNKAKYEKIASGNINKIKRAHIESADQSADLIPNPDSFTCGICCEFILPRKGVTLRNCLHTFCRTCLFSTFENYKYFNQLVCITCSTLLHERERRELIGNDKLNLMSLEVLNSNFFNCKETDCNGIWDVGNYKGKYRCPKCKKVNCIACEDVHENRSCEEYKNSKNYKSLNVFLQKMDSKGVPCYKCQRLLIVEPGRCGALFCDRCGVHVCQFTGKSVGKGGCNCTSANPCHKDCIYGCIPD